MKDSNHRIKDALLLLIWFLEGTVVGFGAILPGISGGTLCVAFGMYRPVIEMISDLKSGMKKYGVMLGVFLLGVAAGFVGLSGTAAWLLEKNTALVTCAFIGFILGTFPELWEDAGARGRSREAYTAMFLSFAVMLTVLMLLKTSMSLHVDPGIPGYLLCGLLWGVSFIVPGLSSSSLLLFFGLYQPMLKGISALHMGVLLPMAAGMLLCVLFFSKGIGYAYEKRYEIVSHGVMGIVAATVVMIFPSWKEPLPVVGSYLLCMAGGAAVSYGFTRVCNKIKETTYL